MQEDWLGTPGSNCGLKRCYMKRRVEDTQSLQRYKNGRKSSQKTRTDILCLDESWETSYKVEEKSCGTQKARLRLRQEFIYSPAFLLVFGTAD
jgi:hypothetical protein